MSAEREIEARVRAIAGAALERRGMELVEVSFRREPAGWVLRVFIDRPGGPTLADCQRMSDEIGTLLEVEDAVPHRFTLEVSTPGLNRPLTRDRHFLEAQGKKIRLVMKEPIGGRRNFTGLLKSYGAPHAAGAAAGSGPALVLTDDAGVEHELPLESIDRARLVYEWPEPVKPGGRSRPGTGKTGRKG